MSPGSQNPLDDDLEREIAEALGGGSLLEIDAPTDSKARKRGNVERLLDQIAVGGQGGPETRATGLRKGTITHVGREDVFVEFGPREQGVVPLAHFSENPDAGTLVQVHVDSYDAKEGIYLCSLRRGVQSAEWDTLEKGAILMGQVLSVNKGGLDLQVGSLTAFLPASQVGLERVEKLETLIGQSFPVEVTEVDRERRRIVVSRRGLLGREREEKRTSAVKALLPGTILAGRITKVEPFGCFVDLGNVEGLVHVSQMSWSRVEKPEDVAKAGDQVKVQVLEVAEDGRRISLSMKALQPDPWVSWTAEHPAGSQVEGTVTRLAAYGGFIEVAPGVEGLAHVSQLAPNGVRTPREVLHAGQKVNVRVVNVDVAQHRIGLSLLNETGDRLTDDVADRATIQDVLGKAKAAAPPEPTLGDLLKKALHQQASGSGKKR